MKKSLVLAHDSTAVRTHTGAERFLSCYRSFQLSHAAPHSRPGGVDIVLLRGASSAFFPAMFPAERAAAADKQVAEVLALTRPSGRAVLDLCCGPGLHAVAFAVRGLDVTVVESRENRSRIISFSAAR